MAGIPEGLAPFKVPAGISFLRLPSDFMARCKTAGLGMQEQNVLAASMAYQLVAPDGSIYLKCDASKMIAANCGMSDANVRKAIAGLRKKGVLAQTDTRGLHRLELDLWGANDSHEKRPMPLTKNARASPEKQAVLPVGSACASPEKRNCFPGEAALKKTNEIKNTPKKRGVVRANYD